MPGIHFAQVRALTPVADAPRVAAQDRVQGSTRRPPFHLPTAIQLSRALSLLPLRARAKERNRRTQRRGLLLHDAVLDSCHHAGVGIPLAHSLSAARLAGSLWPAKMPPFQAATDRGTESQDWPTPLSAAATGWPDSTAFSPSFHAAAYTRPSSRR